MITKVFSVYDSAAKSFSHPFYVPREEQARRAFSDAVNSGTHEFSKHPGDYTLYLLGEWNDSTAVYLPLTPGPQALLTGLAALNRKAPDPEELDAYTAQDVRDELAHGPALGGTPN